MRIQRKGLVPRPDFVRDAPIFVIATEGEKTERQYLSLFENPRVHVEVLPTDLEGLSAPKHVLERLAKFEQQYDLGNEDELWLMVDVDKQRGQFLDKVTQIALESGYRLAISNPCFELWLLLHFRDADPADTTCDAVKKRLQQHLGGYNKGNLNLSLYTPEKIRDAVQRAKSLDRELSARWPSFPGTHVFKVVEKLLHYRISE